MVSQPPLNGATATALALLTAVALLGMPGCSPPADEPPSPESVALELFEPRLDDAEDSRLAALFGESAVREDGPALRDALAEFRALHAPRVLRTEALADEWVVDLEAGTSGEGSATFAVLLTPLEDGGWRIAWFGGPEADWPTYRAPRGPGLTSLPDMP